MFESLQQRKIFFSPDQSNTGGKATIQKKSVDETFDELTSSIRELERVNKELREARRATFNLLEDAVQSKEALRKSEQKYRAKLEEDVFDRTVELKRSQHQYASLVENTPDAIARWNKHLRLVYANTAFAERTGKRLKDLYGKTNLEMGHPDHIAVPFMSSLKKVFETGQAAEHYNSFPSPDGEFNFFSRIVPEKDENGQIETVLSIGRDITELRRSEQVILKLQEEIAQRATDKYLNLFNIIEEGFVVIQLMRDKEGTCVNYKYLEVNPAFERQVGLESESILGKTGLDVLPSLDGSSIRVFGDVVDKQQPDRFERYLEENGRWYEVLAHPLKDDRLAVLYNDITESKRREQQQSFLERRSRYQKEAFRSAIDGEPLEAALNILCRILKEEMGEDVRCAFYLAYPDRRSLYALEDAGDMPQSYTKPVDGFVVGEESFACGLAIATSKPILTRDIFEEPEWNSYSHLARDHNFRACGSYPILTRDGKAIGTFAMYFTDVHDADDKDFAVADAITQAAGIIIARKMEQEERIRAERALGESEENFRIITNAAQALAWVCAPTGENLFFNDRWYQYTGQTKEEAAGYGWTKAAHPEDWERIAPFWQRCQETGETYEGETRYRRYDGEYRWFAFRALPRRNADNKIEAWYGLSFDIHNAKLLEETLRQSQLTLAKDLADTKTMQAVSGLMAQEADMDKLCNAILDAAVEIMHADFGTLQVWVPEKNALTLLSSNGFGRESSEFSKSVTISKVPSSDFVFANKERINIPDVLQWDKLKDTEELKLYRSMGIRSLHSTPLISRSGKPIGLISTQWKNVHEPAERELSLLDVLVRQAADMLQRIQSEEALRESEEKLKNNNAMLEREVKRRNSDLLKQHELLNQAEQLAKGGSWEYNVKTKEFFWSDGMYRLFDIRKGERISPDIYLKYALTEDRPIAKRILTVITESFEAYEKTIRIRFDHSFRSLRIKTTPLKNDLGEVEKMLGVDVDITEAHQSADRIIQLDSSLIEMNKELKLANRELQYSNDQVTRLNESVLKMNRELNSANSELRNFSSITANNYTEALRHVYINLETIVTSDARNLSNSSRANLRRAQAAIQKMKLLTHDIHNYLQLYETGVQKQMTDLNTIVNAVITKLKPKIDETNAQISIGNLPKMLVDVDLVSRLMTNLIDNAIKFRKQDTQPVIRINHSQVTKSKFLSDGKAHEPFFVIEVADNGIGFEYTEKIFELFSQLEVEGKYKGAGMGLPVCKKIMEMHGGFITADSKPGEGSVFSCYFPPPGYKR